MAPKTYTRCSVVGRSFAVSSGSREERNKLSGLPKVAFPLDHPISTWIHLFLTTVGNCYTGKAKMIFLVSDFWLLLLWVKLNENQQTKNNRKCSLYALNLKKFGCGAWWHQWNYQCNPPLSIKITVMIAPHTKIKFAFL